MCRKYLDDRAVLGEQLFEVGDMAVALFPQRFRRELVHADHKHVLVVRAVEERELAQARRMAVHPPQEVVLALFRGRHAERRHAHAAG